MRTLGTDVQLLGLARDWADVRLHLPFADARRLLIDAASVHGSIADAESGELIAEGRSGNLIGLREFKPLGRLGYQKGLKLASHPLAGALQLFGEHPSARAWSMFSGSQQCASFVWDLASSLVPERSFPPQVNRVDYALDFRFAADRADELFGLCAGICARRDVRRHYMEGTVERGRTFWFNWQKSREAEKKRSPGVPVFTARLYQKGLEQGGQLGDYSPGRPDPDWWRFEAVCRPTKPVDKENVFLAEPDSLLGARDWHRDFLHLLGYGGIGGFASTFFEKKPDLEDTKAKTAQALRTMGHMVDQYRNAAQELAELVGWDRVEAMILDALRTAPNELATDRDGVQRKVRPGDAMRAEADRLWIDRLDKRFLSPLKPNEYREARDSSVH